MQNTASMYTMSKPSSIGGYSHPDGTTILVDIVKFVHCQSWCEIFPFLCLLCG